MKRSEKRTQQAKQRIFEQIEILMNNHDLNEITFSKIAKRIGCQPNSVAYYFDSKMDMLLQFMQGYIITADTELLPVLRQGIEAFPPVEKFCREIDCLFAVSDHKSKPRLLNNYFLVSNAPLHSEFCEDLNRKTRQDMENIRTLLEGYKHTGLLCEERFDDTYIELEFYIGTFSLMHIFKFPIYRYEDMLHNVKEYLKARFLKDGVYVPSYRTVVLPNDYYCADIEAAEKHYSSNDKNVPSLKLEILQTINALLSQNRPDDITFSKLAELCYSQPSGIAYYFRDKDDMLLQALILKIERGSKKERSEAKNLHFRDTSLASLCDDIHALCSVGLWKDSFSFWANYFIISGIATKPEYRDYFCYFQRKKCNIIIQLISRFIEEDFFESDAMQTALSEIFCFKDGYALHLLFQSPLLEAEKLKRITENRYIRKLIKPAYHDEAFDYLNTKYYSIGR